MPSMAKENIDQFTMQMNRYFIAAQQKEDK
jgi:hypothetical protein